MTIEDVFFEALAMTKVADRSAYLDRVCGDNAEMRRDIEELLASHARSEPFLDVPAGEQLRVDHTTVGFAGAQGPHESPDLIGSVLDGKYKIVESIGEGGMGSVYLANQLSPIKRRVAVKVVKAGMDSKVVLARFDAERQALAMMDHPNIAKVLDAGTTPTGRPYFAMELVKGVPITTYCDEQRLSPRQRLELFVPVCQAIQHAHQKGIIHRDLKPSNVLIALYDNLAVPKVIDFGVAKAMDSELTEQSLMTGFGMVLGTPEYMSPEQASLNNLDIDTRSDVYSLGVMLYELLTGSTPVDRKSMVRAGLLEVLRVVREVEPPKPSERVSTIQNLRQVAANRNVEPTRLSKLFQGEIDCVILKAIDKDRTRRYETANGLARDIQRYLADEVVEARPASRGYRLMKFVRHHQGAVVTASLVLTALTIGVVSTTWQAIRAEKARANEERRAEGERAAKVEAQTANELTAARLRQIENINNTVFDIFKELDVRKLKREKKPIESVLARELIQAGEKLDANAVQDPDVFASLQNRLGRTLINLGSASEAIPFLKSSLETRTARLGRDANDTHITMSNLAAAYRQAGQNDRAIPLLEEDFELLKAKRGPEDPATLTSMNNLALAYGEAGQSEKALSLLERSLTLKRAQLAAKDQKVLAALNNLATAYVKAGREDEAIPLYDEAIALMKANDRADHPDLQTFINNRAIALKRTGATKQSLSDLEETLKQRTAKLGADHPSTLISLNNLATAYWDNKQYDKALPLFQNALAQDKSRHGTDHPSTLISRNNLAMCLRSAGKVDEAIILFKENLSLSIAKIGFDHPYTQTRRWNLASTYEANRQWTEAEALGREFVTIEKKKSGPTSAELAAGQRLLADICIQLKKWSEAEQCLREFLDYAQRVTPDQWVVHQISSMLGGTLLEQQKFQDAATYLKKALQGMDAQTSKDPTQRSQFLETIDRMIKLCRETNQTDDLRHWQAERDRVSLSKPQPKK